MLFRSGSLSRRLAPLKRQLLDLIALLEAGIDFAEDDIDVAPDSEIARRIAPIEEGIDRLARSFAFGKLVRAHAAGLHRMRIVVENIVPEARKLVSSRGVSCPPGVTPGDAAPA